MNETRRQPFLFWGAVTLFLLVIAWWMVFFYGEAERIVARVGESGVSLSGEEIAALQDAVRENLRMFLFEGAALALIALGGVLFVVRSMRREVEMHRQQRDFLSAITHELRSPIAAAQLQVDSARDKRITEEQHDRYLNNTLLDLERLNATVEKLLTAARASSGRIQLHLEMIDLARLTEKVVNRMRATAGEEPTLEFTAVGPVPVFADAQALETIVENLLSNAIKYGGEPPQVEVHVRRLGDQALLEVGDRGQGITAKEARLVFTPFVRGESELVKRRPGLGLGLYLVSELCRALGGSVHARGRKGGGAVIQVSLPSPSASMPD